MNKADLKARFGHLADTDRLVDDIRALLSEYNHRNSEYGVSVLLTTYFINNSPLIELFMKHPNYDGNLRIVTDREFSCDNDERSAAIRSVLNNFALNIEADRMLSYVDDDGKSEADYRKALRTRKVNLRRLSTPSALEDAATKLNQFGVSGVTVDSQKRFDYFQEVVAFFSNYLSGSISNDTAAYINARMPVRGKATDVSRGMKTSRAFNRACSAFGVDKHTSVIEGKTVNLYEREFAKYSDIINQGAHNRKFVVSVHPYDYLTMSFGKSWASCHTIDTQNRRGMDHAYHGQYCNGTLSYMLDDTSIITYVVNKDDDIQTAGKLYRNMFHWNGSTLLQGRVYPQANDGCTDLYKTLRLYMQNVLSGCLGVEDMWVQHGNEIDDLSISSYGSHYRDYENFEDCNYSSIKGSDYSKRFMIGHNGICPYCGEITHMQSRLSHDDCTI